jgi:hypothetical protein
VKLLIQPGDGIGPLLKGIDGAKSSVEKATRLLAPSLGLPAEAKPLTDPVLVQTAAA